MFKITMKATRDDVTPERVQKMNKYPSNFASTVRKLMKEADGAWGWCNIDVTASVLVGNQVVEHTVSLGACSYRNEAEFVAADGYFDCMVKDAIRGLRKEIAKRQEKQPPIAEPATCLDEDAPGDEPFYPNEFDGPAD